MFKRTHATSSNEDLMNELNDREKTRNPYPLEVFHPKLSPFLEHLTSSIGFDIPRPFVGTDLLSAYSTAIGTGYKISTNGKDGVHLVIWSCKVGISSSGKSLSWIKIGAPLRKIQDNLDKRWEIEKQGKTDSELVGLRMPMLFIRDIVVNTLMRQIMPKNPKGLLKDADELIEWINGMNSMSKKEGTDEQFWLSSWNCTPYSAIRAGNQKFTSPRPFINVNGGTQYSVLPDFFRKNRDTSGFIFRILFCRPKEDRIAEPTTDFVMPEDAELIYTESINKMYMRILVENAEDEPRLITVSKDANESYNLWVKKKISIINSMEDIHDKDIHSSILGKIKEYILRFAGILAISDKALDSEIKDGELNCYFAKNERADKFVMERAIKLGEYYFNEAVDIYNMVQKAIIAPKEVMDFYNLWKTGKYGLGKIYKMVHPIKARVISDKAIDKRGSRLLCKYLREYPKIFNSVAK